MAQFANEQHPPTPAASPPATPSGPVTKRERIQTLDVLRGFALLGILLVNMSYFANPVQYAMIPHPDTNAINRAAEWLVRFLAEGKFFSLFSFLFGLGFTIQMTRAEAKGTRFIPRYLRRLAILLVIGLLHGLLLWVGDILVFYAILGVFLIFFRRMKLKWVWTWAIVLVLLPSLLTALGVLSLQLASSDPATLQAIQEGMTQQLQVYEEMAARAAEVYSTGSFVAVTQQRVSDLIFMWAISLFLAPSIFAMFLVGSIFGRQEYIHKADQHVKLFRNLLLWGGLVGIIGNAIFATQIATVVRSQTDWPMLIATVSQAIGAPALMLAYMAALTLGMLHPTWRPRLQILAPVGRMALTNYLLQSLICTTIYYGYGLGLFGTVGAMAGIGLSLIIYVLQIPWSHWWLARFHFGPVEWLWRTLTYGRVQPFRLTPSSG